MASTRCHRGVNYKSHELPNQDTRQSRTLGARLPASDAGLSPGAVMDRGTHALVTKRSVPRPQRTQDFGSTHSGFFSANEDRRQGQVGGLGGLAVLGKTAATSELAAVLSTARPATRPRSNDRNGWS